MKRRPRGRTWQNHRSLCRAHRTPSQKPATTVPRWTFGSNADLEGIVLSSWRQAARGLQASRARQVPKTDASVILLSVPRSERDAAADLAIMPRWRRLRSGAALLIPWDGGFGRRKATKSSLMWRSNATAQSARVVADGSSRKGWQPRQQPPFQGQLRGAPTAWPGDGCRLWPDGRRSRRRQPTWPVA